MPNAVLPSRRLHRAVHLLTGGLLMGTALVPRMVPDLALTWLGWSRWLLSAGAILALSGFLTHRSRWARPALRVCLGILSTLLLLGLLEMAFRLVGYDFNRTEARLRRVPPFFRKPGLPTGTVFYRRPGPDCWTGRVLHAAPGLEHLDPHPYAGEPAIRVSYDAAGFRNERGWTDWLVAVAGDSFTELGHLPFEAIFTTRLAEELGAAVRNLGVSHTGPFTHLHYLETYGLAPSTRQTVIVFFEGNDPEDAVFEADALETWTLTGRRPWRGRRAQTSLLRATREFLTRRREPAAVPPAPNAWLMTPSGPQPVTLGPRRGLVAELSPRARQALDRFLEAYEAFGRRHGVVTRLVYLPAKETVWRDFVTFGENVPADWEAVPMTDLPEFLERGCQGRGIRFLDLTPVFLAETRSRGTLLFSGLYDTHLTAEGASLVGRELARWLREDPASPPPPGTPGLPGSGAGG